MSIQIIIRVLGGIGLFLFAVKLISDSLQLLAGDRLRRLIGMLTSTPLTGVLAGAGVTVLIQSSSAVTVMTVSFVDAGLMTLKQAIGVIMGANIGTTVTGQILAVNIKSYAYLFVLCGALLSLFCKSGRAAYAGNGLLGFGLLFVGMETIEGAMSFLHDKQDLFLMFSRNPLTGLTAGMLLTLLVQSSSAAVGLTIALGTQGLLPLEAAIPIILGDNIGTTVTAVLASLGADRTAKQACAAHVLFNVIGVCIFLPLMPFYIGFIQATSADIGHQIANAHTLFNVCNTLLFLPFITPFSRLVSKIVPESAHVATSEVRYLDPKLIDVAPGVAVEAVKNECSCMGEVVLELLDNVEKLFFNRTSENAADILRLENKVDALHRAIGAYAESIFRAGISDTAAAFLHGCVSSAGDLERIADKGRNLLRCHEKRRGKSRDFSPDALRELHAMFTNTRLIAAEAVRSFSGSEDRQNADTLALHVRNMEAELRILHLQRIGNGSCDPEIGILYVDVLGTIEQMAYRAKKITHINAAALR